VWKANHNFSPADSASGALFHTQPSGTQPREFVFHIPENIFPPAHLFFPGHSIPLIVLQTNALLWGIGNYTYDPVKFGFPHFKIFFSSFVQLQGYTASDPAAVAIK
jgi:hypothetical protein